jgi:hypothetical protein
MALVINDRVKETSTTTGTGTFDLAGASQDFISFVSGVGNGNTTYYCIANTGTNEFEVGIGTVTDAATDTLSRDTVISNNLGTTNEIDFGSGEKEVFCTIPAVKAMSPVMNPTTYVLTHNSTLSDDQTIGFRSISRTSNYYWNSNRNRNVGNIIMSQLEVDKIIPQSGTTLTIGDSGDTITVASGATLTGDLNADNLTSGTVPLARISGAYTGITQTGTLTNSGAPVSTFNRTTNDGTIIDLRKDGTTVGLISSLSSIVTRITFDPRTNGASLTGGVNKLSPGNENGATNNTLDLGSSTSAFKDLYLGGGLYVGGTAAANLLDDYEEGDWTPGYGGTTGSTGSLAYNTQTGRYTKIGRFVSATGEIRLSNKGSFTGVVRVSGLPFAPISGAVEKNLGSIVLGNVDFATGVVGFNGILASGTNFYINKTTDNAVEEELNTSNVTDTSNFYFNFTYTTNA